MFLILGDGGHLREGLWLWDDVNENMINVSFVIAFDRPKTDFLSYMLVQNYLYILPVELIVSILSILDCVALLRCRQVTSSVSFPPGKHNLTKFYRSADCSTD